MPRLHFHVKLSNDDAFKLKTQALNDDPRLKNAGIAGLKFSTDKQFIVDGEFRAELPPEPANTASSGDINGNGGSASGGKTRVSVRMDRNVAYALKTEMLNRNPHLKELGVLEFKLRKNQLLESQPEELQSQRTEEELQSKEEQTSQPEGKQLQSKKEPPQPKEEQKLQSEEKHLEQKAEQSQVKERKPETNAKQVSQSDVIQKSKFKGRFFKAVGRLVKWGVGLSVVAAVAVGARTYIPEAESWPVIGSLPVVQELVDQLNELVTTLEPSATEEPTATKVPTAILVPAEESWPTCEEFSSVDTTTPVSRQVILTFSQIDDEVRIYLNGQPVCMHGIIRSKESPIVIDISDQLTLGYNELRVVATNGPGTASLEGSLMVDQETLQEWRVIGQSGTYQDFVDESFKIEY